MLVSSMFGAANTDDDQNGPVDAIIPWRVRKHYKEFLSVCSKCFQCLHPTELYHAQHTTNVVLGAHKVFIFIL